MMSASRLRSMAPVLPPLKCQQKQVFPCGYPIFAGHCVHRGLRHLRRGNDPLDHSLILLTRPEDSPAAPPRPPPPRHLGPSAR